MNLAPLTALRTDRRCGSTPGDPRTAANSPTRLHADLSFDSAPAPLGAAGPPGLIRTGSGRSFHAGRFPAESRVARRIALVRSIRRAPPASAAGRKPKTQRRPRQRKLSP